jgi:hypothetical protein
LTSTELNIVTNLTITGTIDATDFVVMRDNMPNLSVLDLSAVNIQAYKGNGGTNYHTTYPANQIPEYATVNPSPGNPDNTGKLNTTLSTIKLPNSIASIGFGAFQNCENLTSVVIPNSVTSIGDAAFVGCSKLTNVIIGNSVTSIGDGAFENCGGLTSVIIPNSVISIGDQAFYFDPNWGFSNGGKTESSLTSVSIGNSVILIGKQAFQGCTKLTNVIIPNSVTTIDDNAFYGCSGLISVTIGHSVSLIGRQAFENCDKLAIVYSLNSTTPTLEGSCFGFDISDGSVGVNKTLFVPMSALAAYKADARWISYFSMIKANPN